MSAGARGWAVLVTCEHGGNDVPEWLTDRFVDAEEALASHRGWDPGAMGITKNFCASLGFSPAISSSTHFEARTSRLVADLNRSVSNPALFSEFTRDLPPDQLERILEKHYHPYRQRVERTVRGDVEAGMRVAHISVHTFTAALGEERREFDAGILFDPAREPEAAMARRWIEALRAGDPAIDVRENQPYLGTDDGLTAAMRAMFPPEVYVGIEIEVRNDLVAEYDDEIAWGTRLARTVVPVLAMG